MTGPPWLNWHVGSRIAPGETISGDDYAMAFGPEGGLFAVIDGLGHGLPAAQAAARARSVLMSEPCASLDVLVNRCHQELRKTRGAVVASGRLDRSGHLDWLGVGNIGAVLLPSGTRERRSLSSFPGVVGASLPTLKVEGFGLLPGDMLVVATDGIRSAFAAGLPDRGSPEFMVEEALHSWRNAMDDALVLALLYLGSRS
jgi:negative regulator of sigma-B (phosphoserine phosphatase)